MKKGFESLEQIDTLSNSSASSSESLNWYGVDEERARMILPNHLLNLVG